MGLGKTGFNQGTVVAGDAILAKQLNAVINKIVNKSYDREVVGKAVHSMLNRISKSQNSQSKWHLRTRDGGIVHLDLLIQAMRLENGNLFSNTGQSPLDILDSLAAVEKIKSHNFTELKTAISLFNEVHHCIRLTFGDARLVPNTLPVRLQTFMLTRIDLADEEQLALLINESLDQVHNQLLNYSRIENVK